jgi:hypothetical protein
VKDPNNDGEPGMEFCCSILAALPILGNFLQRLKRERLTKPVCFQRLTASQKLTLSSCEFTQLKGALILNNVVKCPIRQIVGRLAPTFDKFSC